MQCSGPTPAYRLLPNALSDTRLETLKEFTTNPSPRKQWYGRLNLWNERFQAVHTENLSFKFTHVKHHKGNSALDELTTLFLRTVQSLGAKFEDRPINRPIELEVYIDRNQVNKENAAKSDLFWHRDGITTSLGEFFADYSMVYLLSQETGWKGGDMLLQSGGRPIDKQRWENSKEPITTIRPSFNQAVVFKNSDSAHRVEAIEPIGENVQRDVLIITCKLDFSSGKINFQNG